MSRKRLSSSGADGATGSGGGSGSGYSGLPMNGDPGDNGGGDGDIGGRPPKPGGDPDPSPPSSSSSSSSWSSTSSNSTSSSSEESDKKEKAEEKKDRVTRKEAETESVPVYPKIHQLVLWKSQLTMSLVTASGGSGHQKWLKWLAPAWNLNTRLDDLNKVKREYRAIDIKMCLAMTGMLKTAGDPARTVRIEVEKLQRHRAKHSKTMSGREVIAITFENFRSSDNVEVMCLINNLIHLKYPGDSKILDFCHQWRAILEGVREENIPPRRTLRDILYKKIRDSNIMKFDLSLCDQLPDSDVRETYGL